jgi:hypothetical protein
LGIGVVALGGIIHLTYQIGKGYSKQPLGPAPGRPEVSTEGSEMEMTGE